MKTIDEALKTYNEAETFIGKYFNTNIFYGIRIFFNEKWCENDREITYEYDGDIYSFEIYGTSRFEKDEHIMFIGEDNGEKDHYIFRKSNCVEYLED